MYKKLCLKIQRDWWHGRAPVLRDVRREKKKTPYFKAIQLYSSKGLSYEDIATELNASRTDVKNYIYQGRDKLKKHLLQEVETYSSTKEEYEEEVRYLLKYLD